MLPNVQETQWLGRFDQDAEDPASAWEVSDRAVGGVIDAQGEELLEPGVVVVQDPQGGVARARDLPCGLKHTVQHSPLVELSC
jgi:hypothetical protein